MVLLLGAATIGLILAMLALGVYVSFRTFRFPDITAEGSLTLGAAVSATLLVQQWSPWLATLAAFGAGLIAGAVTGTLHTKFKINGLLSGILVMTALYSINLHIMGKSNVALSQSTTLVTQTEEITQWLLGTIEQVDVLGWSVNVRDLAIFFGALLLITILSSLLYLFYKTNLGTAMRASGDNPQMIRALGVSDETLLVLGLALANGFIALSGAFLTQYQGFADVQMGIGMVVWGLASVIIGEALVGTSKIGLLIASTVLGSILFRLLIAIALRWGLNPNDLKLITAVFVLVALIAPSVIRKWKFSGIKVTTAA